MREIVSPLDGIRSPFGRLLSSAAFNPVSLFASGEEGALFLPGPTTSFLSTTDLTPAGAGDTVGFQLDSKEAGYSGGAFTGLGSELVVNGTFDTDTSGWSGDNATLLQVSGELEVTATASGGGAEQTVTTEVGKVYRFSADYVPSVGRARIEIRRDNTFGAEYSTLLQTSSSGTHEITFVALSTATYIRLEAFDLSDVVLYDNISVRELPGNHATQGTAAARPVLARVPSGGRRNLLEYTEDLTNARWTKRSLTATANTITENTANDLHQVNQSFPNASTVATYTVSATVSLVSGSRQLLVAPINSSAAGNTAAAIFNLSTGTYVGQASGRIGLLSGTTTITGLGGGKYRVAVSAAATTANAPIGPAFRLLDGTTEIYTGDGTSAITVEEVQYEISSTASAYQKVVSEYDVTEAGVDSLWYLDFDGVDDGMATASIDFTSTDKMSVFVGVEKESETSFSVIVENGVLSTDTGTFAAQANGGAGSNDWNSGSRGNAGFDSGGSQIATSDGSQDAKVVLSGLHDISGDSTILRINGTEIDEATGDKGSGNFSDSALSIGARGDAASAFFDGRIYGLIVRGATSTAGEISNTETFLAGRSGVTL